MAEQSSFRIREKKEIAPETFYFEAEAPLVARSRRPGQFVIITPTEYSERIPISLAGGDPVAGTIIFAVQRIGRTTQELCALAEGDRFYSILGPLGEPTPIQLNNGTVVCVGGGYGAGAVVPIARGARELGNKVIGIIGARDQQRLIFTEEMETAADQVLLVTEDGSRGHKGMVTDAVAALLEQGEKIAHVYAIGPVPMMRAIAAQTQPLGIGCTVSLNAIMVDGTGMCGGCRVQVGDESKFACCDGPDFDAHQVNWDLLIDRQHMYTDQEKVAAEFLAHNPDHGQHDDEEAHTCRMEALVQEYHARFQPNLPEGINPTDAAHLTPKQRMSIPRQIMPEQDADTRTANFMEVALGLTEAQARAEAQRCLDCKNPNCMKGCPVGIDIPAFLKLIANGDFAGAARKLKEANCLPAITGRVCPQETQCEAMCLLSKRCEPVAIGRLERFIADWERQQSGGGTGIEQAEPTGRRVAVVGSGPASLTVAGELARHGHKVTIFEALHRPGGVLVYGIPEFRLPNDIVEQELETLRKLGVEIICGALIGRSYTLKELIDQEGYDAVFLGTGAGLPKMMKIPGEDLKGSYTANEYLTRINLMRSDLFPKMATPVHIGTSVAGIGGGDTAMDCARTSRRMGCEKVTLLYRRTEAEMPARAEEIAHAKEEGVELHELAQPVALHGDENGWVREIECIQMELGEPDDSGRRRPTPIEGSNFRVPAETVVSALGFGVNPLIASTTPELKINKWGVIEVDENRRTSIPRVYAGGDAITGGATVILAMGHGKQAAQAMHEELMRQPAESTAPSPQ